MKQSRNLSTGQFSDEVKSALRTAYNLNAVPRLTVDWNWNRYSAPTADNIPAEDTHGFDNEMFPISSIVEPNRPTKGIIKARVGEATVAPEYMMDKYPRFYIGDYNDIYKYWTSPERTDSSGTFPLYNGDTVVRPFISYDAPVRANKIVIQIEDTWASPSNHRVLIKSTVAGSWTEIGPNNPDIDNDGVLTLYYNGNAWVSTKPDNLVTTNVAGIMYRVRALGPGKKRDGSFMTYVRKDRNISDTANWGNRTVVQTTGAKSSLNLIAISAHLEADLTDRLINVSDDFEMSETSQLYPIGTVTSNQARILLSNDDGVFDKDNESSIYAGLLEPNAEFNLEYIYTINDVRHSVQQFRLYGGIWGESDGTVEISLEDHSKFLKEIKPRKIFYSDKSVIEIIWRVLDSVGFNAYDSQIDDILIQHKIPYFWTTGEETVWEVLDSLATQTQTAIYFDENNRLQVRGRAAAFGQSKNPDWTLLGQNRGDDLADIISWSPVGELEGNKITVSYSPTKWKVNRRGKPALEKVWEPESDALVVRSTPLVRHMTEYDMIMHISPKDAKIWPYSSKVYVDAEIIEYEGKRYAYYTGANGNTVNYVTLKDADELETYNKKTPAVHRGKNGFTGGLVIKERGVWNTKPAEHTVDVAGYKVWTVNESGLLLQGGTNGFTINRADSTAVLNTPGYFKGVNNALLVTRGSGITGYKMFGTRVKFDKDEGSSTQRGGIAFNLGNLNQQGYYIELTLSSKMNTDTRKQRSEVMIYSFKGGDYKVIDKGKPIAIIPGRFYDVDVYKHEAGDQHRISVYINGQKVAEGTTEGGTKQTDTGRVAMYARGKTKMQFEYLYAINRMSPEPRDDFGFYDLRFGGMRGDHWHREFVWEIRTKWKRIGKKKQRKKVEYRWNGYLFDEFNPYVREVREFDVTFDPAPVQYSFLFSTNEWSGAVVEYIPTPFGASFVVVNTSRGNAILSGEDNLTNSGQGAVQQVFLVLGRTLEIGEDETVVRKNEKAIRAQGLVETELTGEFIQTKGAAKDIANWIAKHWSEGADEVEVVIFANPLIELGDVVNVDYEEKSLATTTHRYFVTKTSTSFDDGMETTLTLRRAREASASDIS